MSKFAFIGDAVNRENHTMSMFSIVFEEDIPENKLYGACRHLADALLDRGRIVIFAVPIQYNTKEEGDCLQSMVAEPSALCLLDELGVTAEDFIFVNPSFAFGDDIKGKATVGIKCSPAWLAHHIAKIAKQGCGGALFAPVGREMVGVVVYDPREKNEYELHIGRISSVKEAAEPDNILVRYAANTFDSREGVNEWIETVANAIEAEYGSDLIVYPLPEENELDFGDVDDSDACEEIDCDYNA